MPTPTLHVARDGTETWKVRYRDGGRQTSMSFNDRRSANKFAKTISQVGVPRAVELWAERKCETEDVPTLKEWCGTHIEQLTGVGASTIRDYQQITARHLGNLADLPITLIRRADISRWVNETAKQITYRGTPIAGKTIANRHGFISAALNHAVRNELIPANPCLGTRLPRSIKPKMTFLTHDEYLRFIGCFPAWRQPLVATMFTTGMRWGEITALKVGDLVIREDGLGTLAITKAWKNKGKELGAPKTRRSERTITVSPEILALLRLEIGVRGAGEWLFTAKNGVDPVRHDAFYKGHWLPAVALANGDAGARVRDGGRVLPVPDPLLGKRPTPHDARHTAASWLLAAGIPINYVQAHLGHESITTTVDRYGHVMPAAGAAIAAALSQAISPAHPLQIEA